MTPHLHRTRVEGCYRCDLDADEVDKADALEYAMTEAIVTFVQAICEGDSTQYRDVLEIVAVRLGGV